MLLANSPKTKYLSILNTLLINNFDMEPSWKNGKDKKEMLEKAKRLIDHVLSKGYSMTNRDLYRCIEVGIGFSPISIPNPIPDVTFAESDMQLTYLNTETGKWEVQTSKVNLKGGSYQADIKHFSSYAVENKVTSKVSSETVVKSEVLGQASRDNSENPKAVTGIALTYKEKSGWECKDADITNAVKSKLSGASDATINAMVAFFKTRLYSLMGSASGVKTTERTYNTVNVNGYTTMNYTCYAKTRTTTLSTKVLYKGSPVTISVIATRYTGTDHQYKTVTTNPTHSGGKGGSN